MTSRGRVFASRATTRRANFRRKPGPDRPFARPGGAYDLRIMSSSSFGTRRAAHAAARYRNAALVLGLAVSLLAGTAIWLVAQARSQVWEDARRNQEDVALAVKLSIDGLLAQSTLSLDGIRADLAAAPAASASSHATQMQILREAQRFDP